MRENLEREREHPPCSEDPRFHERQRGEDPEPFTRTRDRSPTRPSHPTFQSLEIKLLEKVPRPTATEAESEPKKLKADPSGPTPPASSQTNTPIPLPPQSLANPTVPPDAAIDTEMPPSSPSHGISFKDKLLQGGAPTEPVAHPPPEDLTLTAEDVAREMEGHIPSITFSPRVQQFMSECMKFAVIVKILGRFIRQDTLLNKITTLWKPKGRFKLTELERGCYMVKLDNETDYANALLGGPWVVFGHYLVLQPWAPTLSPANLEINHVYGWVRLPGLPYHYYHKSVLREVGDSIGQVLKIDYNTEGVNKARFARLAVKLDLTKPLISRLKLDGVIQYVEYEGLPTICYQCGRYGHLENACPCKTPLHPTAPVTPATAATGHAAPANQSPPPQAMVNAPAIADAKEKQAYGAWM